MEAKPKRLNIRLSQADYDKLIFQTQKLNMTQAEFMRELIRKSMCDDIKAFNTFLEEVWRLTRIMSNNINQIAKKVNTGSEKVFIFDVQKINEELKHLCLLLKS